MLRIRIRNAVRALFGSSVKAGKLERRYFDENPKLEQLFPLGKHPWAGDGIKFEKLSAQVFRGHADCLYLLDKKSDPLTYSKWSGFGYTNVLVRMYEAVGTLEVDYAHVRLVVWIRTGSDHMNGPWETRMRIFKVPKHKTLYDVVAPIERSARRLIEDEGYKLPYSPFERERLINQAREVNKPNNL